MNSVYPKYIPFLIVTSEPLDCNYFSDCPKGHCGHYLLQVSNFLYTDYTQGLEAITSMRYKDTKF
jgi:hypothetical protein